MNELLSIAAIVGGFGGFIGGISAVIGLFRSIPRGSDRENRRAAAVAVEVAKDDTVTALPPADRERGGA